MGLDQLNFENINKVQTALLRYKSFEPKDGYYLSFSGGKDSIVIYDLAVRAGVNFKAFYHVQLDPPELVQFIKREYPEVTFVRPVANFWKLIEDKGFPMRKKRWCCEYLKEHGGGGRAVVTGVRAQESAGRRKRKIVDRGVKTRFCAAPKFVLHPIIDWSNSEVWEYIKSRRLAYPTLYDEGFRRIGCVMCPLANAGQRRREMERFPIIAGLWLHAFERLYVKNEHYKKRWKSGQEMFDWWIGAGGKIADEPCRLFG